MKSILSVFIGIILLMAGVMLYNSLNEPQETIEPETPEIAPPEPVVVESVEPELTPVPEVPEPEPKPTMTFEERHQLSYTTLTDTKDRKIEAKVLSVTETHAKIRRQDGLETTIPLSMLSADDIAYCEYVHSQAPLPTPTPSITRSTSSASMTDANKLKAQGGIDWDAIFGSE